MVAASSEITGLLKAWSAGDRNALDRLMPVVYDEIRQLAHRYMKREWQSHSMQTTALINEAYLRLVTVSDVNWSDRAHFFAVSAQLMRRILVMRPGRDRHGSGLVRRAS
jgi:RNA polymerase sigma-70 factor, ECF subfamily